MTRKILDAFFVAILRIIARVDLQGLNNIPASGACIMASNHIGRLDVLLVYSLMPRKDVIMLVAEKYSDSRLWRWVGKRLDAIFVERFEADYKAVRQVMKRLKQGELLAIAPEGTRSRDGKLTQAKSGAVYLAAKAGIPIIPVGILGTDDQDVAKRLKKLKRLSIIIRVGKPFLLPANVELERDVRLEQQTNEMMCQIAALLPAERHGYYRENPRIGEILAESLVQA